MATEENWNEDLPEDIKRIGNTMTRMRIMIGRRIIGRMALAIPIAAPIAVRASSAKRFVAA